MCTFYMSYRSSILATSMSPLLNQRTDKYGGTTMEQRATLHLEDSYEAFFDEYVAFMKSYQESANPASLMTDYLEYIAQYTETMEKLSQLGEEDPCPPVIVGVGLGGTIEQCALEAKKALLMPMDQPNPDAYYADMERSTLEKINALGIGPQGMGGRITALGVHIRPTATHIAGLPCVVNMSCHVTRHAAGSL